MKWKYTELNQAALNWFVIRSVIFYLFIFIYLPGYFFLTANIISFLCCILLCSPSGVGHLHYLQMPEDPGGSRWHRPGTVHTRVTLGFFLSLFLPFNIKYWTSSGNAHQPCSSQMLTWDIFFCLSTGTGCTAALQTAPSSWVAVPKANRNRLLVSCQCQHIVLSSLSSFPSAVGVGHSDPAESQHYTCSWQPCVHAGLIAQHVVQRLPKGH